MPKVEPNFSYSVEALTVKLKDTTPLDVGAGVSYEWNFGDKSLAKTGREVTHTYQKSDIYAVTLTIVDNFGNWHSAERAVSIYNEIQPDFSYTKNLFDVTFLNTSVVSNSQPVTYSWDFGDGSAGSAENAPTHTYSTMGIYPVVLTLKDSAGGMYKVHKDITISQTRVTYVDFQNSVSGLTVSFTNNSVYESGEIVSWAWSFGDGTTFDDKTPPPHTYALPGVYEVMLTATDKGGMPHVMKHLILTDNANVNIGFDYITDGLSATFMSTSTADVDGITGYEWDFGDGSPNVSSKNANRVYGKPGRYDVTLTVTDRLGAKHTLMTPISVSASLIRADFSYTRSGNSTVIVKDETSGAVGDIVSYLWDFGDGVGKSTLKEPAPYTYTKAGMHKIKLTVTDKTGNGHVMEKQIVINSSGVTAGFTFDIVNNTNVQFNSDKTSTPAKSYLWDFGDGTTATTPDATHTYTAPGTYKVTLTVTDEDGVTYTMTKYVTIPNPYIFTDFSFMRAGYVVDFTNTSVLEAGIPEPTYLWQFGDGATAATKDASHTYTIPNTYSVTLTLTDAYGVTHTMTKSVTVTPSANIIINELDPDTIEFKSDIVSLEGNLTYAWDFGDGTTANTKDATHSYSAPGVYTVTLTVTDIFGTTYTVSKIVRILASDIKPEFTYTSAGLTISVKDKTVLPSGATVTYQWDFGDGSTATTKDASHTYIAPGKYPVKLTVTDRYGAASSETLDVTVLSGAVVKASFSYIVEGTAVTFKNESYAANGATYEWNFGDGSAIVSSTDAAHLYGKSGNFTVTLTATDGFGMKDIFTAVVGTDTFKKVINNSGIIDVTLALTYSGDMYIWGTNKNSSRQGYLGMPRIKEIHTPVRLNVGGKVKDIAIGTGHLLALTEDGLVYAWGDNGNGQLGLNDIKSREVPTKITVYPPGTKKIVAIDAGTKHSLAVDESGAVYAWGANDSGQLGLGNGTEQHIPQKVNGVSNIATIIGGQNNSYAIDKNGKVWGWGYNGADSLLGIGDTTSGSTYNTPRAIDGTGADALKNKNVIGIAASTTHVLAVTSDGILYAWGSNINGQLGTNETGASGNKSYPTALPASRFDGKKVLMASTSHGGNTSLAVAEDGTAWSWGRGTNGNLGFGDDIANKSVPTKIPSLSNIVFVFSNNYLSFAVKGSGEMYGFGTNSGYSLGDGTNVAKRNPTKVVTREDRTAADIAANIGLSIDIFGGETRIRVCNTSIIRHGMDDYAWVINGKMMTEKVPAYAFSTSHEITVTMRILDVYGVTHSVSRTEVTTSISDVVTCPVNSMIP